MRFFYDALELLNEIERDLSSAGVVYQTATVQNKKVKTDPGFETKELVGYGYKLFPNREGNKRCFKNMEIFISENKPSDFVEWCYLELEERIFGNGTVPLNPGKSWEFRKKFWEQYLESNGMFAYTYSERWREQIPYVIAELKKNPNSRQAILTVYDRHQDMLNWGGKARVPCSLSYHFMIRNNKLECIYHQRSCDFYNFYQADVFFTTGLQEYIARQLNLVVGPFTHMVDSLHAFKKDLAGVF